ncbi:MAG: hypothetical protein ACRDJO_13050, partial [Actinomycetota bacterium]
ARDHRAPVTVELVDDERRQPAAARADVVLVAGPNEEDAGIHRLYRIAHARRGLVVAVSPQARALGVRRPAGLCAALAASAASQAAESWLADQVGALTVFTEPPVRLVRPEPSRRSRDEDVMDS